MIVRIKLELTDVLQLVTSFAADSEIMTVETQHRGQVVIEKIADQLDAIIAALEADAERKKR